ncbi:precorrin-3B synthase [Pseudomonas matsuisoli]|uniref:Precorrin-3B synthase n=1 Tax=Pseudomonas matsuisoli TaxID=1515666 RepID=A0A917PNL0_9PSED|nr:precorrin-3B synthase [Pseudomonas matsuisoli]GGJ85014.1 precorrin-3B synthase [Pseudomonas matsuisoli]
MSAQDGGICRVKLAAGRLTATQARVIAESAARFGNSILELTNRSNLQIRGVRLDAARELAGALVTAGLGPRVPGADDVRNVLLSPAAGRDPSAYLDTRALGDRLLDLLQDEPSFHGLSAKFAILLDGGEVLSVLEHPHDIWLSACPDGKRFNVGLAGIPGADCLGSVADADVPMWVDRVLRTFLAFATPDQSRIRDVMASAARTAFLREVTTAPLTDATAIAGERSLSDAPGVYRQRQAGLCMVVAQSCLGRLEANQLAALATLAERYGRGWIHLTPWQGVVLPDVEQGLADEALAAVADVGMLVDPAAPLTRLVACSGNAGCAKAQADTKADAVRLADALADVEAPPKVHLSGCARSCASARVQPFTLLAQPGGRYHLYQRIEAQAGLGLRQASDIDIESAAAWLRMHHRESFND